MTSAVLHPVQSLGQPGVRHERLTVGGAWAGALSAFAVMTLLAACDRPGAPSPKSEAATPKAAPKKTPALADDLDKLLTVTSENAKSAEEEAWERQADDIMAAHANMSAQDLLNVPEVNAKLRDFLQALSKSTELQDRMNKSIKFAATMKNLRGTKEDWQFSMDLSGYEKPRTHRLLTSLLSGKPDRVLDFFEHEVTEATTEFSFDPEAKRSSNGISLAHKPAPPPKE